MIRFLTVFLVATGLAGVAQAQVTLSNDKPVQISSDTLDVHQDVHQAVFSGNVIATQGAINMRADEMIVHYRNSDTAQAAPAANSAAAAGNGVEQIDAKGHVIFSNPTDTATGDFAVYHVDAQTLELTGDVLLTRDKNILKGTRMVYNLSTGRSVLTANGAAVGGQKAGNGRVHGLFVPAEKKENASPVQPAGKTPSAGKTP